MTRPPRKVTAQVRPGARTRLLVNLTGAGLWLSGGLWLVFHYFMRRQGEWGPEPHELEPWWLRLHGGFAFLALWTIGLLWGAHIVGGWASGRRRWTGVLILAWLSAMMLSGYLLLYAGDDGLLGLVSPTHWIAGLGLPLIYALHRWFRRSPADGPRRHGAPNRGPD